jgi:predicted nuclease of predicted toxin-antitoxin system
LIITQDNDFGTLVHRSGKPHSGVLLLHMPGATRQERTTTLLWLLDNYASAISGHFSVFQNDQLRIRSPR